MKLLCKLFGHRGYGKGWWGDGKYGRVIGGNIDGIGTYHFAVQNDCSRCGDKYVVARFHGQAVLRAMNHSNAIIDPARLSSALIEMTNYCTDLKRMGNKSSKQFKYYAEQHLAKRTREADQKAAVNMGFHMEWEELLDGETNYVR